MKDTKPQATHLFLSSMGFLAAPFFRECNNIEEVITICQDQLIKSQLDNEDIEFDGLVIKVRGTNHRNLLGTTNHHPRRAIAYKYPAKQAITTINEVEFQVGRTGILTPVAYLEPTELSGVTIARVSLHNPDFIEQKDIRIGDKVVLQRSGEVIPYIVCSLPEIRDGKQIPIRFPDLCPVCHETVHKEVAVSGNTSYYCINASCPASTKEKIRHFVGRDMMDIQGLGDAIIEALVDNNIINTYADLYNLKDMQTRMIVKNLPGMGDKKIDQIIKGLEQSKIKELDRIIYALGIPQVGEKTAKVIVDHITEILKSENVKKGKNNEGFNFTYEDLIGYFRNESFLRSIHSIGPETISSIMDWVQHEHNVGLLEQLSAHGVDFSNFGTEVARESERLQYLRFAISGIFEISRDQIISYLVKQGASYNPNITKNTNMLIIGQNPSSKVSKASKQGIEVLEGLAAVEKKLDISFGLEKTGLF